MIEKLRYKFILITMCSALVVLATITVTLNILNDVQLNRNSNQVLELLADNDGRFPKPDKLPTQDQMLKPELSPEVPFQTRFFTIKLSQTGQIVNTDIGKIAAISEQEAIRYANKAYQAAAQEGRIDIYKYTKTPKSYGELIVFVDYSRELDNSRDFLMFSIVVASVSLFLIFIPVLFFSRLVFKPVAESYQKQKQFITDAGHEIKTPLAIIGTNAEVIEIESGQSEWISNIKSQIARLSELTEDLIGLARMDEVGYQLEIQDLSLSDLAQNNIAPYQPIMEAANKQLKLVIEEGVQYRGNRKALSKLITLLMDNMVKYTNVGGRAKIQLSRVNGRPTIVFYNTVEQIQSGKLDILFERFYRLDDSRASQTGGHGLGLAIAKSLVKAHKGKIQARSEDGKSLTITIQL